MPNTFKSLFFNLGTTADTNLYNVPPATTTIIKSLYVGNVSGSTASSINVSVGATGATAAFLIKNASIPYGTTLQIITEPVVLEANDRINAQASAINTLDITLSYLEIT